MKIAFAIGLTISFVVLFHSSVIADDALDKIEGAKSRYQASIAECHESVQNFLNDREDFARKRNDTELINQIAEIRKEFNSSQIVPDIAPRILRDRARKANILLVRIYEEVINSYVRAGQDANADDLRQELMSLLRPKDTKQLGKYHYRIFTNVVSWEEAEKACREMHGRLAVIHNQNENDFITRLAKDAKIGYVWIGATDKVKEGNWQWLTGESLEYSNWRRDQVANEPNNYRGNEDYAVLNVAENGKWHDNPNRSDHKPGFVCQWD